MPSSDERFEGLSVEEAARRLATIGPNELPSARARSLFAIAVEVMREPMLLLLVSTGLIYVFLGDLKEAMALVGAIGLVVGVTIYQQGKTERTLAALRELSSPTAIVVRSGVAARIAGRNVVPDDVIILNEGDRVPADGVLLSTMGLAIDESLLTGESVPVRKHLNTPHLAQDSKIFSGTVIVAGSGTATITATGQSSQIGRIGLVLDRLGPSKTPLEKEVAAMVQALAVLGLGACAIVGVLYGITRGRWLDGALAGLTMAISMIPEEFPVVLTVFLALGASRISRNRVLTRRVSAIETLGAATVLCVDKTGTLTLNRMTVAALYAKGRHYQIDGLTSAATPALSILEFARLASKVEPFDPMEQAFMESAQLCGIPVPKEQGWTLVHTFPLSDELLAMAQIWRLPERAAQIAALKGAPEAVLDLCILDENERDNILAAVNVMASEGLRVLAVGQAVLDAEESPTSIRTTRWSFLGLVGLADPVRVAVPRAIAECAEAGIRVIMLTGDHPATALRIAQHIGLSHANRCLTGAELAALDDEELLVTLQETNVFARVVPEQKLRLVSALQRSGEVVAMTGDGVNDAPALKAADIGIAMGRKGTDVAREAADLVLLDDDFTSIVGAIRTGRRIYDNIRKAMCYVLSVHVPIAGMSLLPALAGHPLIILPLHLIFMEMIVDPACSVAFEMEPEEPNVMRRPPRSPDQPLFEHHLVVRSLIQGMGALLVSAGMFFYALSQGEDEATVRTMTFVTLVIANLALIFTHRSLTGDGSDPRPGAHRALAILSIGALGLLGLVLLIPFLTNLFHMIRPSPLQLAACGMAGLLTILWVETVKFVDLKALKKACQ